MIHLCFTGLSSVNKYFLFFLAGGGEDGEGWVESYNKCRMNVNEKHILSNVKVSCISLRYFFNKDTKP